MSEFDDYTSQEHQIMQMCVKKGIPLRGSIELLPLCNLSCKMCYVHLTKQQMDQKGRLRSKEEWINIAKEMVQAGTLFILLTGGEPLLYPEFKELYLELRNLGMIIDLNTNGTLIDEKWADFFMEYPPRRINVTIYGKDNHTYERLCGYKQGYDKVIKAIQLLKERNINLRLGFSVTLYNVEDIDEIIQLKDQYDSHMVIDSYMLPSIREKDEILDTSARLDAKDAGCISFKILKPLMGEEIFDQYIEQTMQKIKNYQPSNEAVSRCYAGRSSFTINWQGNMRPCVILEKPEVNVFEHSFIDAWQFISSHVSKCRLSEKCNQCHLSPICKTCMAASYLETRKVDGVPEYLCDYTKEKYRLIEEYANEKKI